jgi:hypothetical protein
VSVVRKTGMDAVVATVVIIWKIFTIAQHYQNQKELRDVFVQLTKAGFVGLYLMILIK